MYFSKSKVSDLHKYDRVDTKGSCDLYLCLKKTDGTSKEQNLSSINTRNWESQPFFSPDMQYLYFVSNRRGGFGGNDIWRSEITKFGFSEPENLVQPSIQNIMKCLHFYILII